MSQVFCRDFGLFSDRPHLSWVLWLVLRSCLVPLVGDLRLCWLLGDAVKALIADVLVGLLAGFGPRYVFRFVSVLFTMLQGREHLLSHHLESQRLLKLVVEFADRLLECHLGWAGHRLLDLLHASLYDFIVQQRHLAGVFGLRWLIRLLTNVFCNLVVGKVGAWLLADELGRAVGRACVR